MLCTFESVIDKWKQAIDIALSEIKAEIESRVSIDVEDINRKRNVAESNIFGINEK